MRFILPIFTFVIFAFSSAPAFAQRSAPDSFADLVEGLLPAVVNISSTQKAQSMEEFPELPQFPEGSPFQDFFEEFMDRRGRGMPSVPPASMGSGFIIDAEKGYIITNNHVIKGAEEVRVTFQDDETVKAEIIGSDEKTDIAVLKVDTDKPLTAVAFGPSKDMRVGDWVVAIGNPFGLGGTVTAGIISARQRDINAGPYDDFIQTDASINRGNSGGPMFDLAGNVIGINTAIFSPSGGSVGIGFAIPSDLAMPVIDQIIKYGRTRRGWLGVRIQTVSDEIAESLGLEQATGALVASVTPDSPAEKAALQPGDIILEFNGQMVEDMRSLPRLVAETEIDSTAKIVLWRDGQKETASVTVGELEKAEDEGLIASSALSGAQTDTSGTKVESLGLSLKELTPALREEFEIADSTNGVIVSDVESGSEAADKSLLPGDVIVEMNQQALSDPKKAKEIAEQAVENSRASVLLLVNRNGDVRFVALRLKKE